MTNFPDENGFHEKRQAELFSEPAKHETASKVLTTLRAVPPAVAPATFELSDRQAAASFQDLIDIIRRQRWKLAGFIAFSLAVTALGTLYLTPLYESTVAINVERRGNGVVGQEASAPSVNEMDQIMMTQVELIESDPVLRPVVDKYHLLDLEHQFLFLNQEKSARLRQSRTVLKRLKVTRAPNTSILKISYRAPDPKLAADIVTMIAKSYVDHAFDSHEQSNAAVLGVVDRQLIDLREKMAVSDGALTAFARDLGFADPDQRASALSSRLLQLNSDYTAAQSERLHKESLFNATRAGSLASAAISNQGSMMDNALIRLNQSKSDFEKISTIFGEGHSEYQKALREKNEMQRQFDESRATTIERVDVDYRQTVEREQMARDLLAATKTEVDGLTAKAFEFQRLKNEAENYRKLYDDLERITREQVINRGFQQAILQVVDPARPSAKQAFPNLILNLLAAFVLSVMSGLGGVAFLDTIDGRVRTPEDAARLPNVDVIGAMPTFGQTSRKRGKDGVVTATMPQTGRTRLLLEYQEFIRILRNSIMVTAMDRPFRTLVITDPRTNENASNVAANLAFSYARLGQKVLLIDADLREPSLHRTFEKTGSSGFAEVIAGEKAWRETVVRVAREQLFLMPAGVMTENSSDLISTGTQSLLETVREEFDLVLIKAPPVLTAAESVPLAGSADAVLVMARAQFTSSKDITAAYSLLRRARANVLGLVVNDVKGLMSPKLHTPSVVASRAA